jgi:hypothetical protein
VLNNACASGVGFDPGAGVAATLVRGMSTGRAELESGAPAAAGEDGVADCAGVPDRLGAAEVCWTGNIPVTGSWWEAGVSLGDGVADVRAVVRGAPGRLGCGVLPAAWDAASEWLSGSRITPANVSGRRGPCELAIATTATALMAVAAIDRHSAGARTAGMPEACHAQIQKDGNESK